MKKTVDKPTLETYLLKLRKEKFTGTVKINLFKGGVTNLNVGSEPPIWEEESVKVK